MRVQAFYLQKGAKKINTIALKQNRVLKRE